MFAPQTKSPGYGPAIQDNCSCWNNFKTWIIRGMCNIHIPNTCSKAPGSTLRS